MAFHMLAYYLVSWWYRQLWPSIQTFMQVIIYEHLHLSWGSICLHNIWFHGATGNCGCPFSILCKSSFINIYICCGVPYACIIFVSWWYRQLWPSILNIMQVVIYEHLHLSWFSICLHNIWFHGGTGNCGCPF